METGKNNGSMFNLSRLTIFYELCKYFAVEEIYCAMCFILLGIGQREETKMGTCDENYVIILIFSLTTVFYNCIFSKLFGDRKAADLIIR